MTRTEALVVDHEAAIRKLAWGSLQGPWQVPTELVRLGLAAGARTVDLGIERRRIRLTAPEACLPRQTLADLVTLLDPDVAAATRHRALAAVQEEEAGALAAAATRAGTRLHLRVGGLELERTGDGRIVAPRVAEDDLARPGLEIELHGLDLDPKRAETWLGRAARWCERRVTLDGRPLPRGFEASLVEGRLPGGAVPVRLALVRRSGPPRLWLLRHGLLAATATVTDFPCFEAALELGAATDAGAPASALRELAGRELELLLDGAVDLALLAAQRRADREDLRRPLARFLLEIARGGRSAARICSTPMLLVARSGTRRRVDLNEVSRDLVRRRRDGTSTLEVADPGTDVGDLARPTLIADGVERALVAEVLGVRLISPALPTPPGPRERLRRALAAAFGRALALGRRVVDPAELTPGEIALREGLEQASAPRRRLVAFLAGSGTVLQLPDRVLLPRGAPLVRRAVRAVERDRRWLYPAWLALLGDREPAPEELRRAWLRPPS